MIHGGLVSITFRQLDARQVVALVKQAELTCIEWGGDVHVPHGEVIVAKEVRDMMNGEGLVTAAYGSYYKVGESELDGLAFKQVVDSSVALDAPVIRVWAGSQGTSVADEQQWGRVIDDGARIAEMAKEADKEISFEFHGNTLTDHGEAAVKLINSIGAENVSLYWQPLDHSMPGDPLHDLEYIQEYVHHVHVFSWTREIQDEPVTRHPLIEREDRWLKYFERIASIDGDRCAMIEFVKDNNPEQFLDDAKVLRNWINK
ncbi:TIM barrel protein [Planctomycetota bacterium]|nr:TIM barrel protein [Planctomycetota bacterium]